MKKFYTIALCALIACQVASAAGVKVTASIDSTVVEMGSRAVITVNVSDATHKGAPVGAMEAGADMGAFDVIAVDTDTTPAGYTYKYTIQAFYPGVAEFGPFAYAVGNDTAESDIVTLKVNEVSLDSLTTINPMEGAVREPSKWYDFIPDWLIWSLLGLFGVLLLIAAGIIIYRYRRDGRVPWIAVKPIDPYVEAMAALDALKRRRLAESGNDREYYTALVDILRVYLYRRFGINAMEMSSTQILDTLKQNPETRDNQPRIKQILEVADFVKFARQRPLPDDNIKSFETVRNFVESTRPLPEPENDKKTKGSAKS